MLLKIGTKLKCTCANAPPQYGFKLWLIYVGIMLTSIAQPVERTCVNQNHSFRLSKQKQYKIVLIKTRHLKLLKF